MLDEIHDRYRESVQERGAGPTFIGCLGILVLFIAIICGMVMTGVTGVDEEGAARVLRQSGYKEIKITGYRFGTCGSDDFYHTGFRATAPNGELVSGTVCRGAWLKASTIRLD